MGMTEEDEEFFNRPIKEKMNDLIKLLRESESAYWCKYCNRHISNNENVFVHDNVFHPTDWVPECGGEHKIQ